MAKYLYQLLMELVFGFGLWCLKPLSTIFQLHRGGQFCWWRNPENPEKNTNGCKSLNTLPYIVVSSAHRPAGFELTTLLVIGTNCIGSFKSDCHTNLTTTISQLSVHTIYRALIMWSLGTIILISRSLFHY